MSESNQMRDLGATARAHVGALGSVAIDSMGGGAIWIEAAFPNGMISFVARGDLKRWELIRFTSHADAPFKSPDCAFDSFEEAQAEFLREIDAHVREVETNDGTATSKL
jgi:hypothetical protein